MSKLVVDAQPRDVQAIKARHLRNDGLIPVVVYGKGLTPVSLAVPERSMESALRHGAVSQLVEVQVSGGKAHNVLVREVQRDPINHRLLHVDLYAVRMDEKQHVSIRVSGVGKPDALTSGLMILQNHESIVVEALPADLPAVIEVDLTHLSSEQPIKVSDLPSISGVVYAMDADEHIFSMVATQAGLEDEEQAAAEESSAEPEVVRKGKAEEGAE